MEMAEIGGITKNPIMGQRIASTEQMIAFARNVNPAFRSEIAFAYARLGVRYGVKGDVAFCQAIYETNWFRFGGNVQAGQNNFAGLGSTGGGVAGASFASFEEGVTAHIQHLYAYATTRNLPAGEQIVDPRYAYVKKGSAPYWEDLAGRWAVPGYDRSKYPSLEAALRARDSYGQRILELHQQLVNFPVLVPPDEEEPPTSTDGYPSGTVAWKKEAIEWLYQMGLLTSTEWKAKIDEPLPLWSSAILLKRLSTRNSGDAK